MYGILSLLVNSLINKHFPFLKPILWSFTYCIVYILLQDCMKVEIKTLWEMERRKNYQKKTAIENIACASIMQSTTLQGNLLQYLKVLLRVPRGMCDTRHRGRQQLYLRQEYWLAKNIGQECWTAKLERENENCFHTYHIL